MTRETDAGKSDAGEGRTLTICRGWTCFLLGAALLAVAFTFGVAVGAGLTVWILP